MASTPAFASTPRAASAALSAANTNRDGTGAVVTVFTAGSGGSKIEEVRIVPAGATTPGIVRLFLFDGSTYALFHEAAIAGNSPSASQAVVVTVLTFDNLMLPSGWSLRASTHNAEAIKVHAFGGDF